MEVRAWLYSQICLSPPFMTDRISLSTFCNLKKKKKSKPSEIQIPK